METIIPGTDLVGLTTSSIVLVPSMFTYLSPVLATFEGPKPNCDKTAVYMQAPPQFIVEMLDTAQRGKRSFQFKIFSEFNEITPAGAQSYGMRICPTARQDSDSSRSAVTNEGYEIWRHWEECLWFQEAIGHESARLVSEAWPRSSEANTICLFESPSLFPPPPAPS
ncbi:hypothetical protein HGRIS_011568 [Hohenbuehelia grisea]|uniref:Uncharacterized protein n=1 Tax=Hohenbuehelia grisea TaxID=104357 RepID=A0ABR3JWH4_9AGAR